MDEENKQSKPDRYLIQVLKPEISLVDEIPICGKLKEVSLNKYNGNRPNYYHITPKSISFYSVRGPFSKKPEDWKFIYCDVNKIIL